MRYLLFFSITYFYSISLFSQTDSITFVKSKWKKSKIAGGVVVKQKEFENLFGAKQSVSIVELRNRKKIGFGLDYEVQNLLLTSTFGQRNNALATINGTFFDTKNGGSVAFLKVNGQIINSNFTPKDGKRTFFQQSGITINQGKLNIIKWDGSKKWEHHLKDENVMLTGPLLVYDDQIVHLDSNSFNNTRHPRSVLATTKRKVYLIAVDGRNELAAGMTIKELANISRWLNAVASVNLDGGGSTTLYVKDIGVINHPSDNKKFDHEGERKVANVILLKKLR